MTEDHQDENLPNSDKPKAIVRRLTWPIDPSLPSRDVKTDRGPDGGSTAIPLGCDRRTRKFSSPLAPLRRRVRPKVATTTAAHGSIVDACVPRSPPSSSPSPRSRFLCAGRRRNPRHRYVSSPHAVLCNLRSSPAAPSSTGFFPRSPPSTSHTAASRHFSGDAEEDRRDGEEAGIAIRKNRDG